MSEQQWYKTDLKIITVGLGYDDVEKGAIPMVGVLAKDISVKDGVVYVKKGTEVMLGPKSGATLGKEDEQGMFEAGMKLKSEIIDNLIYDKGKEE